MALLINQDENVSMKEVLSFRKIRVFDSTEMSKLICNQLMNVRRFYYANRDGIMPYVNPLITKIRNSHFSMTCDLPVVTAFGVEEKTKHVITPTNVYRTLSIANHAFGFHKASDVVIMEIKSRSDEPIKQIINVGFLHYLKVYSSFADLLENSSFTNIGTEVPFIAASYSSIVDDGESIPLTGLVGNLIYEKVGKSFILKKIEKNEYRQFVIPIVEWE